MSATVETLEAMERPPVRMSSRLEGDLLEVSMGPQHPSTHGVFRMNVALEGEIVRKLKPVFGYLHRNHEQIGRDFFFSSRRRHTRLHGDWSSDVCSSDLRQADALAALADAGQLPRADQGRRSEERRVGKECRSRCSLCHEKKKPTEMV